MIAIISFTRSTTILKNISVVQKTDQGMSRNFNDSNELIQTIQAIVPPPDYDTVLYIKCGCKREFIYATYDTIPTVNLTCVCGQKVIEYGS